MYWANSVHIYLSIKLTKPAFYLSIYQFVYLSPFMSMCLSFYRSISDYSSLTRFMLISSELWLTLFIDAGGKYPQVPSTSSTIINSLSALICFAYIFACKCVCMLPKLKTTI